MAKRKYKKLTARQKKFNAEVKKEMIEKGLLPPPKPRLNRRKFACEVRKELEDFSILGDGAVYMAKAIYNMLPDPDSKMKITPEQVGILKVVKFAIEWKRFEEELKKEGKSKYSTEEFYNKVYVPIKRL